MTSLFRQRLLTLAGSSLYFSWRNGRQQGISSRVESLWKMPGDSVKQRRKQPDVCNSRGNASEPRTEELRSSARRPTLSLLSILSPLSALACLGLLWVVSQQGVLIAELQHKLSLLHQEAHGLQELRTHFNTLSDKFENTHTQMETLELSSVARLLEDVTQLKAWASGLEEQRGRLQVKLVELSGAVRQVEDRTGTVARDVAAKVASVRTDVRRMSGLESEAGELLSQARQLEEKIARAELATAKRIGDLLAGSIDRVASLRASADRNAQATEQLHKSLTQLSSAHSQLANRLLELESGRARMLKALTFASDLKPKVSGIRQDLAMLEPLLSDLTVRTGQLAEDMGRREQDIALLRNSLVNISSHPT